MKRALKALGLLYPKSWRNRYQHEFDALLDDVSPSWRTFFDVFGGAMKMQMKIWSAWKIVASFGVAGIILAAVITIAIPKRYVSTAVLETGIRSESELIAVVQQVESRASLTRLIVEENLYKAERTQMPLEEVIEQMKRKDIVLRQVDRGALTISFSSADAAEAQRTTRWLTAQFVEAKAGTVVDPARLPVTPINPRPSRNMVMGLISGVILGSLYALFAGLKLWRLAAGLGLAGAAAGAAVAYWLPERFSSEAIVRYTAQNQADLPAAAQSVHQLGEIVTNDANLRAIVQTFNLYPNESGPERILKQHLHIEPLGKAPAIAIRFDDKNRYVAQKVVANVVGRLLEASVVGRKAPSDVSMTLELLDPPSLHLFPYFPNRPVVAGTGLLVGLACAVGFGLWRYFRAPLPAVAAR